MSGKYFCTKNDLSYLSDYVRDIWITESPMNSDDIDDYLANRDAATIESAKRYMELVENNYAIFHDYLDIEKWHYEQTHTYGGEPSDPKAWQTQAYNLFYTVVMSYIENSDLVIGGELLKEGKITYFNRTVINSNENRHTLIDMFKNNFHYSKEFIESDDKYESKPVTIYLNKYKYSAKVTYLKLNNGQITREFDITVLTNHVRISEKDGEYSFVIL